MNTRTKTKSIQPAMIALAAGNFLFAMGLVMAMQAYLQLQDTAYGGIFSGTDWWKALRSKFPNTGQTEISMGLACLAFACLFDCARDKSHISNILNHKQRPITKPETGKILSHRKPNPLPPITSSCFPEKTSS